MKVKLYYLVKKYGLSQEELKEPVYAAGPFTDYITASDARRSILGDGDGYLYYQIVAQNIDVTEL